MSGENRAAGRGSGAADSLNHRSSGGRPARDAGAQDRASSSASSARTRARHVPGAIAGLLCGFLCAPATGVGLGQVAQQSALGQSLRVVIPLIAEGGEDLASECYKLAPAEQDPDGIPQVQFGRIVLERSPSGARLVVVHPRPVNEPVLRLTVQVGCEAGVRREYVLLMDPPAIDLPQAVAEPADAEPVPRPSAPRATAAPSPRVAAPAPGDAIAGADADTRREPRKAAPAKQRPARAGASRAPDASAQPRLRLSAPPPQAVPAPGPRPPAVRAPAPAQQGPTEQELADAIEAETVVLRQRIAELSATVDRLQQELKAAEEADRAAALARKAAPPPPPPPPWWEANGPLLAAIVGLPALLAGGLLWKRRRESATRAPDWRASTVMRARPDAKAEPGTTRTPRGATASDVKAGSGSGAKATPAAPRKGPSRMPAAPGTVNALAVSELMHVTEEARVFVALGHTHRAIDVLKEHIKRAPASMPAAWLMLLDLHHRNGDRQDFRHLAEEFHARFNVQTPLWDTFVAGGTRDTGLEGFPHVLLQLVALWRKPPCRAYLERLLYDNREGRRTGFPLGAYGDILLLLQLSDTPPEIDIDSDLEKAGKLGPAPA